MAACDHNIFNINSNTFIGGNFKSSQTERNLTQTIHDLLPYKNVTRVPENRSFEIINKTMKN